MSSVNSVKGELCECHMSQRIRVMRCLTQSRSHTAWKAFLHIHVLNNHTFIT